MHPYCDASGEKLMAAAAVLTVEDKEHLATKADLNELRLGTSSALKELELRLTIRMGAMIAAGVGLLAALKFWG